MNQKYHGKYFLYIDSVCPTFECKCDKRTLFGRDIPYKRTSDGDIEISCPTCTKKSTITSEHIESDFDDIEEDVHRGIWICPLSRTEPCTVDCCHYSKPHLDDVNKNIVLRFCGLKDIEKRLNVDRN